MTHCQHIGVVACSAEGAALCYRTICAEGPAILGAHAHPEVTMHTYPLSKYMTFIRADDWSGVAQVEDLVRDAAVRVMRLHQKDPAVQAAMKQWGTPAEDPQSPGHRRLAEAAAVADLFELTLGAGTPLPAEQKVLLKFRAKR